MDDLKELSFSVNDELLGKELSPENMSLPLLIEFAEQVTAFLRGSSKTDVKKVKAAIKDGSFALAVEASPDLIGPAIHDYAMISENRSLANIDPQRARIIESWQALANKNSERIYKLYIDTDKNQPVEPLVISSETHYEAEKDVWSEVELYAYGSVFDLGGKNQPNVHLQLPNGKTLKVQANVDTLAGDRINRLYSRQLIRIKAEQNLETKDYRNETLVSFEYYNPHFDEDEFQAIVKQGRHAWKGIKNATEWVENLRGNYAKA